MTLRRVAAALLLPLVLAAALPAAGIAKPLGGKHGSAPHAESAAPHQAADAAQTADGAQGANGSSGADAKAGARTGGRVPHPELLGAVEPLHSRAPDEASAAAQAQAQAEREAAAQSAPWDAAPHLRVRKTGDPFIDAANLKRLNEELATAIDPDRVRAGSLADDALADDLLARLSPRKPSDAQQQLWRFLRDDPPHFDLYHPTQALFDLRRLTQALRPLQGDTLLVMGHVDHSDGALVFKSTSGRPLRLPLALFEQAAREAGVNLMFVGCKSARHASAGFVDDLNSLDAARAMAQAMHARPPTLFDLYAALSGPQRVMAFDPVTFFAARVVEITAGPDGPVLSSLHWSGPHMQAAGRAASAPAAPPPPAAWSQAGPSRSAAWAAAAWQALAIGLALSWLAGLAALWLDGERGAVLAGLTLVDAVAHLLLAPIVLTVFAEAVAGPGASWWAWCGAVVLVLVAVGCRSLGDVQHADAADPSLADAAPGSPAHGHAMPRLLTGRAVLVAVPFAAVAVLHGGWWAWPTPVMRVLQGLYGLGQPLPGPWLLLFGGVMLYIVMAMLLALGRGLQGWHDASRGRSGRSALWHEQLAADGVGAAAASAAVSARLAFEQRCDGQDTRWDQVKPMADGHAPDPWARLAQRHWRMVAVPVLWTSPRLAPEAAFGLIRVGSPFMHPLPLALLQRWRARELRFEDLPPLLAQVEPRLRWTDFAPANRQPSVGLPVLLGGLLVVLFGGMAVAVDAGSQPRQVMGAAAAAVLAAMALWPGAGWVRRRRHARWLQEVQTRPEAPQAHPPAAAAQ